ncbi:MAG: exopolysaccharide biosynthesis polyprenyl glycosylphosphotransferase [Acetobacteraceae bacterium]
MTRIFGHYVAIEMLLLWCGETALSFVVIYLLLASGGGGAGHAVIDREALRVAASLALAIGCIAPVLGLYRPDVCVETRRLVANIAAVGACVVAVLALFSLLFSVPGPVWLPRALLAWLFSLLASRAAFALVLRWDLLARRIAVVGSSLDWARAREAVAARQGAFFRIAATIPGTSGIVPEALARERIWGIVVGASARGTVPPGDLIRCKCRGIRVFNEIEFRERQLQRVELGNLCQDWLAYADGFSCGRVQDAIRRAADIGFALALLVATAPLMLLAAVAIRLDSAGPVFYRQERVGRDGRSFMLVKFRSMSLDAEAGLGPCWAAEHDSRVTRVGRFIRRVRIDELPQLFNVLRGEMSMIGPRPERPHFVARLAEAIPGYRDRAYVKPGITGWAQVNFRYGASIEDARMKLAYDLYYVKHRSLFLDLLILISTLRVVLFQEGSR